MRTTVIWGAGSKLKFLASFFPNIVKHVDVIIDSYVESFAGKEVKKPDALKELENIDLVICTYSDTIRQSLLEEAKCYGIVEKQILSESEWIARQLIEYDDVRLVPKRVMLDLCTLCQLRCPTCSMRINNYAGLGAGYTKLSEFKQFIEENPCVESVEISNYGEVFLNPDLNDIFRYSAQTGRVRLTINNGTNMNSISDDVIETMAKTGVVDSILVSIDGASQETYSLYRRGGNYDKVINNIRKINSAKRKYGVDTPRLKWQYVLFNHNEADIPQAVKMAQSLNMDIVFKLDWSGTYVPSDEEMVRKYTGMSIFNRKEYERQNHRKYRIEHICRNMFFSPTINYDGRLLGCCTVNSCDWGINVFEDGLINAVNSPCYRKALIALLLQDAKPENSSPCGNCKLFNFDDSFRMSI